MMSSWNGWADPANTRFQSSRAAGLTSQTTPRLKLRWAFGFPGVTTAFGTPTVFAGRVFVGAADGSVYSLDARIGCTYWTFTAAAGVRNAPAIDSDGAAYFGDLRGNVYAVDSAGRLIWKVRADDHPLAVITGSPKLYAGRLYVPVSGRDESMAATDGKYECCTFRGSLVALDAATGKQIWKAYTVIDDAEAYGEERQGRHNVGAIRRSALVVAYSRHCEESHLCGHGRQLLAADHEHQRCYPRFRYGFRPFALVTPVHFGGRLDFRLWRTG